MDLYREESRRIMEILRATGAEIQQVSVDEAYLEFTRVFGGEGWKGSHDELLEAAVPLAREMKERIKNERKLTASIGVASNKFLAKLASDYQKPDGLTVIAEEGKDIFLRPLAVRRIHGVGAATEKVLHDASIFTMGDLQSYPGNLRAIVGSFSEQLRNYAFGIDERPLHVGDDIKSISSEETFERDTTDRPFLRTCLWTQAEEIAAKLKRKRLFAETVQVKVRYKDFTTLTRQLTVEDPIQDSRTIYRLGCHLLARHRLVQRPIRLLGLGVSSLNSAGAVQLKLF
jgi:DNA polymerase-4